jgi:anti-anti-sigma factor
MSYRTDTVQVVERHQGAVPIAEVKGAVDVSNVDRVLERIFGSVATDAPGMVVDLNATTYIDSAGVRILFELARRLRGRGQQLRIVASREGMVRRVLVLTALSDVIALDDTVADSVRAIEKCI